MRNNSTVKLCLPCVGFHDKTLWGDLVPLFSEEFPDYDCVIDGKFIIFTKKLP